MDAWRHFAEVTGGRRPLGRFGPVAPKLAGWTGDNGAIALTSVPQNFSSGRAEVELDYRWRPLRETVADAWSWFQSQDLG